MFKKLQVSSSIISFFAATLFLSPVSLSFASPAKVTINKRTMAAYAACLKKQPSKSKNKKISTSFGAQLTRGREPIVNANCSIATGKKSKLIVAAQAAPCLTSPIAGDVNSDRKVDPYDLLALSSCYGRNVSACVNKNVDIDRDGKISFDDLLTIARNFGKEQCAPTVNLCKNFPIYWNVSRANSSVPGAYITLPRSSRIIQNQVFLTHGFWHGRWPQISADKATADMARQFGWNVEVIDGLYHLNGGIPQRGNLALHLQKHRSDLSVTPADYSGKIVIDMEDWFPAYESAGEPYKKASLKFAKEKFPALNGAALEGKSKELWEKAALSFFLETVKDLKAFRPQAKVGVYDLMIRRYYSDSDYSSAQGNSLRAINDKSLSVFSASDFVVADIYIPHRSYNNASPASQPSAGSWIAPSTDSVWYADNKRYVNQNVQEARRIADSVGGKEVLVYAWPHYHPGGGGIESNQLTTPADFFVQIFQAMEAGANSAVIWDDIQVQHPTLDPFQLYVNSTIVPLIEGYCTGDTKSAFASLFSRVSAMGIFH